MKKVEQEEVKIDRLRWSSGVTSYLIAFFRDIPARQSFSLVAKNLNQIQQKQACIHKPKTI